MQLAHHKQLTSINYFKNPLKLSDKIIIWNFSQYLFVKYHCQIFSNWYSFHICSGLVIFRNLFPKSQWFYYFIVYLRNWTCLKRNTEVNTFYLKSTTKTIYGWVLPLVGSGMATIKSYSPKSLLPSNRSWQKPHEQLRDGAGQCDKQLGRNPVLLYCLWTSIMWHRPFFRTRMLELDSYEDLSHICCLHSALSFTGSNPLSVSCGWWEHL